MPVFRFVKDLLARKDGAPPASGVALADLPRLLDDESTAVAGRLGPAFEEPAREARRGVADLGAVIARLARADWDTALHPKLEQISRTTLPAFVRAMESCLARPLPDDPHEFYTAAAGLLKCAISALRGQGRYLRAVLPDEIKAVKASVDVIGHAVNGMTAALGEEKRDLAALAALRLRLDRVTALDSEKQDTERRAAEAAAELSALAEERKAAETALGDLDRSGAARELAGRQADAERLAARASALEAAHRGQAGGLITVLRRAERLVAKRGDRPVATRLHHLQSTLASPLAGDEMALAAPLAGGLAVVRELVVAGEIAPKEGDPLFDDPDAVAATIQARVDEHARVTGEAVALERELAASPVAQERERLASRLRQIDHRAAVLRDEAAALSRVAEQKAAERATLLAGLEEEVDTVFAGRVRLAGEDA